MLKLYCSSSGNVEIRDVRETIFRDPSTLSMYECTYSTSSTTYSTYRCGVLYVEMSMSVTYRRTYRVCNIREYM
jgi:hypothetical protein